METALLLGLRKKSYKMAIFSVNTELQTNVNVIIDLYLHII